MRFTDLFICRPVLSIVLSLLLLILGVRALTGRSVAQYPEARYAVVTVTTACYGADAATVAGFITLPLEQAMAQAQGIDYLSSSSTTGVSVITANLELNYDSNRALTEISTKVSSVVSRLPPQAQQPSIGVTIGEKFDEMYLGYNSKTLAPNQLTDYLLRSVKPRLESIEGVAQAEFLGDRQYALRAWLDPIRMAGHNVTAQDVAVALANNNYITTAGTVKGNMVSVDLAASTDLHSVAGFRRLAIRAENGAIVRLEDVATVELGAEDYDSRVTYNGRPAVFLGIQVAPSANMLEVAKRIRKVLPDIERQLPLGVTQFIESDRSEFVDAAIDEVAKTLIEALIIVVLVIFVFLGTPRAVAAPLAAIPLSLMGAFILMEWLDYSINLLTLLALVLSVGLVVDDAIVIVENVHRHVKEGVSARNAALFGARELGGPIIAMTVVLMAAYVPIGMQRGMTGALFTQFAFTLVGAVTASGVIALTLSPMMCSRLLRSQREQRWMAQWLDEIFDAIRRTYQRGLRTWLPSSSALVVLAALLSAAAGYFFFTADSELAPQEDEGAIFAFVKGPANATVRQMRNYEQQMYKSAETLPEFSATFAAVSPTTTFGEVLLKPANERRRTATELQQLMQMKWNRIAGAQFSAFLPPSLPGASGPPIQLVIKTMEPVSSLYNVSQELVSRARKSGLFVFIDSDLRLDKPQATLVIDPDRVTDAGMTQRDVATILSGALGGGYVNYFSMNGRSYKVIPQVQQQDRQYPDQILDYYLRSGGGSLLQARAIASIRTESGPESISHFQQLNSAIITGATTATLGEALRFLQESLSEIAPIGYSVDYAGESRQFMRGSRDFLGTLALALAVVYLALAAQFESFRDPVVILVSAPMALFGGLLAAHLGLITLNIYTQVGLMTLLGLVTKHGILIVQFANELQRKGGSKLQAIEEAAAVRLRPILMTTAAMVLGVVPLVFASGAGSGARRAMGIVLCSGLSIGTLFTLCIVPAMYMLVADKHSTVVDAAS